MGSSLMSRANAMYLIVRSMEEVDGNLGFMIFVLGLDASMQSGVCL